MSDSLQPVAGSLEAKIIRKCPSHQDCPLTCKHRRVEDLGEIASFDTRETARDISHDPSVITRLKEAYYSWHR